MITLFAASLLFASIGDLPLESKQVLKDCKIGYRTYGQMNADKSNVILFPTWFNGTTENLEQHIGVHKLVDDRKYYVVTIDALSNGVSSSPSNSATQKGMKFPKINMRDMVESQYIFATKVLGLTHVHAVMGISMGGMQTFQWILSHPDYMDKAVSIVGTPKMSSKDIALWTSVAKGMKMPGGGGAGSQQTNIGALIGMIGAAAGAKAPVPRENLNTASAEAGGTTAGGQMKLPLDKNPFDMLKQFEAIVTHDAFKPLGGSMEQAAGMVKAKVMALIALQDQAVSPEIPEQFIEMIQGRKFEMMSSCGHNAYKCEERIISPRIWAFLDE